MKTFKPTGHDDASSWLESKGTRLQDKSEIDTIIQQGNKYPAFLQNDDTVVCATTKDEARELVSQNTSGDFYAIDRTLVDQQTSKSGSSSNYNS
jgi:hypothetical protein